MSAPAAITASLVDVRNIAAHKCVRLELHVPAEQAGAVMAAFGWPTMVDPVPVALARLVEEATAKPEPAKERRPFSDLPYAQQAALRCREPDFWDFLHQKYPDRCNASWQQNESSAHLAADLVRQVCNVISRADIITGTKAGDRWQTLEAEYWAWQRGRR